MLELVDIRDSACEPTPFELTGDINGQFPVVNRFFLKKKNKNELYLVFLEQTGYSIALGRYPTEVCMEWVQEHPALVSGASSIPPAGISPSQQPLLIPSNWLRLFVSRFHMPWK